MATPASRRSLIIKLAAVAVLAAAAGVLVLQGVDLKAGVERVMEAVRALGPWVFFGAMTLLPAFGFPMIAFTLSAAPLFGPRFGTAGVWALVALSIALNVSLTYWFARYAFRPLLEKWVKRLGYKVPTVDKEDYVSLTLLVRLTPGPPFFLQGYVLGLMEVPFRTYLLWSWLVVMGYATPLVFFGQSVMEGSTRNALFGGSLLVAVFVAVSWFRRRAARRKAAKEAA